MLGHVTCRHAHTTHTISKYVFVSLACFAVLSVSFLSIRNESFRHSKTSKARIMRWNTTYKETIKPCYLLLLRMRMTRQYKTIQYSNKKHSTSRGCSPRSTFIIITSFSVPCIGWVLDSRQFCIQTDSYCYIRLHTFTVTYLNHIYILSYCHITYYSCIILLIHIA